MTDLTEQWKKGELLSGEYYIKTKGNEKVITEEYFDMFQSFDWHDNKDIEQVLAPVPSYEEYLSLTYAKEEDEKIIAEYEEENAQLKELLKECSIANTALVSIMDWLRKSTIPEQRESCAKLFEKTQELQKQLDEALK